MRVLKGILKDSVAYYQRLERDLEQRLSKLPRGSVKRRQIRGHVYFYLQQRIGDKVVHRYLGRQEPVELARAVEERRRVRRELAEARAALRLIPQRKLAA